jgi:uncharacterized membrane protein YjgN (DUF898 family)
MRDPYRSGWGERLLSSLLIVLAFAVLLQFIGGLLAPLIPTLTGVSLLVGVLLWISQRHRRW